MGKSNSVFGVLYVFLMNVLLTYTMSATVACLNFVLASQTEKLISDLNIPATQFNCLTALCDVFSSLGNRLFFSFSLSFDNLILEIQSM